MNYELLTSIEREVFGSPRVRLRGTKTAQVESA
jgi:hypothetical protein